MTSKIKRKYTPCYTVLRVENPCVLGVFEYLDQAEVFAENVQKIYNDYDTPLTVKIQPSDYCHF